MFRSVARGIQWLGAGDRNDGRGTARAAESQCYNAGIVAIGEDMIAWE
jgi:hypothetical protein